ncbi:MAG: hypothetical protein JWO56_578 [Acidobacteria bacterium]|nr:hypothetical protein [Acidobacteriota bacterium]
MPTDKQDKDPRKEQIKVTDKRIFTPDGEIREEFRDEIHPAAPQPQAVRSDDKPAAEPAGPIVKPAAEKPAAEKPAAAPKPAEPPRTERRRTLAEKGENPNTPFTNFVEPLIAQGYMSLGLLRNPYSPENKIDVGAARQMIDILSLLQEKTAGNLTPDEEDFLALHLGELKLAYVQRTKSI